MLLNFNQSINRSNDWLNKQSIEELTLLRRPHHQNGGRTPAPFLADHPSGPTRRPRPPPRHPHRRPVRRPTAWVVVSRTCAGSSAGGPRRSGPAPAPSAAGDSAGPMMSMTKMWMPRWTRRCWMNARPAAWQLPRRPAAGTALVAGVGLPVTASPNAFFH